MNKKSIKTKTLEGNRKKVPLPDFIEVTKDDADVPKWERVGKIGMFHWNRLAPELKAIGRLTVLNKQALIELCKIYEIIHKVNALLMKANQNMIEETVCSYKGCDHINFKESAYSKMLRNYQKQALNYESKLKLHDTEVPQSRPSDGMEALFD